MSNKDTAGTQGKAHSEADRAGTGKVAQEHNSAGDKAATQTHQERRTPESRGDRDSQLGSGNQGQSRQGTPGSSTGGGNRGAG